jgi:hypothetical protein
MEIPALVDAGTAVVHSVVSHKLTSNYPKFADL